MRISDWSSDVCSSDLVSEITTPYRAKHPHVKHTILSRNSIEILSMLENLEVDAGLTYLDTEPHDKLLSVSLHPEQHRLLHSGDSHSGDRHQVSFCAVRRLPPPEDGTAEKE